jgi:hypothetical protein
MASPATIFSNGLGIVSLEVFEENHATSNFDYSLGSSNIDGSLGIERYGDKTENLRPPTKS